MRIITRENSYLSEPSVWQGKHLVANMCFFLSPCELLPILGSPRLAIYRMAHMPHFTFLSLNLSSMCGLHVYKIKFGFSSTHLFCNNSIMWWTKRTFGWQSKILPNSTILATWFNQKFLTIMDTKKWIVGKEDSFRLSWTLVCAFWNWKWNECRGRNCNNQRKGEKQKKLWAGKEEQQRSTEEQVSSEGRLTFL